MPPRRRVARAASGKPQPTNPTTSGPGHDVSEVPANSNQSPRNPPGSPLKPAGKTPSSANVSRTGRSVSSKNTLHGVVSRSNPPSSSPSKRPSLSKLRIIQDSATEDSNQSSPLTSSPRTSNPEREKETFATNHLKSKSKTLPLTLHKPPF